MYKNWIEKDKQFDECPYCNSENIEQTEYYRENGYFTIGFECQDCERDWNEGYIFEKTTLFQEEE